MQYVCVLMALVGQAPGQDMAIVEEILAHQRLYFERLHAIDLSVETVNSERKPRVSPIPAFSARSETSHSSTDKRYSHFRYEDGKFYHRQTVEGDDGTRRVDRITAFDLKSHQEYLNEIQSLAKGGVPPTKPFGGTFSFWDPHLFAVSKLPDDYDLITHFRKEETWGEMAAKASEVEREQLGDFLVVKVTFGNDMIPIHGSPSTVIVSFATDYDYFPVGVTVLAGGKKFSEMQVDGLVQIGGLWIQTEQNVTRWAEDGSLLERESSKFDVEKTTVNEDIEDSVFTIPLSMAKLLIDSDTHEMVELAPKTEYDLSDLMGLEQLARTDMSSSEKDYSKKDVATNGARKPGATSAIPSEEETTGWPSIYIFVLLLCCVSTFAVFWILTIRNAK